MTVHAGDGELGIILQSMRNKGLLDLAGDVQFLLKTLAFPFMLDEAGSFKDASGLPAEGIQPLLKVMRANLGHLNEIRAQVLARRAPTTAGVGRAVAP